MIQIPGGSFYMGRKTKGYDELYEMMKPRHKVTVQPFKIGKYEVSFDQWDVCVMDGGCAGYRPDDEGWGRGSRPVISVSWYHAQSFIAWLNNRTKGNYRLPTEAEWEYAARAKSRTIFPWGNKYKKDRMNCGEYWKKGDFILCDSYKYTAPAGSFPANPWGLHDMHGNVNEWVQDCWHKNYRYAPVDGSAWESDCDSFDKNKIDDSTNSRVYRGGSWQWLGGPIGSDGRMGWPAFLSSNTLGFRLAHDN